MNPVLLRQKNVNGQEIDERLMLDFNVALSDSRLVCLKSVYEYWQSHKPADGQLPTLTDLNYRRDLENDLIGLIGRLDVSPANPMAFHVDDTPEIDGFSSMKGLTLNEHPFFAHAVSTATDFMYCKFQRTPGFYEINQCSGELNRHYVRLMLPVADETGDVVCVLYVVNVISSSMSGVSDSSA